MPLKHHEMFFFLQSHSYSYFVSISARTEQGREVRTTSIRVFNPADASENGGLAEFIHR